MTLKSEGNIHGSMQGMGREFDDDSEQEMGRFVQANRRGEGVYESSRIRYFYVSKRTSFQNVPFL